jgi:hypothetical protein
MEFPLNEQDALDLSNIHRGTRERVVADKLKCIKLLSKKHPQSFIADLLDIDDKTVYNWKKEFLGSKNIQDFVVGRQIGYSGRLDGLKKTAL